MNGLNRKLNFARKTRHSKMGEAELEANLVHSGETKLSQAQRLAEWTGAVIAQGQHQSISTG